MDLKNFIKKREQIKKQLDKYNAKYAELENEFIEDKKILKIGDKVTSTDIIQIVDGIFVEEETNDIVYVMISNVLNENHGLLYKITEINDNTYTFQIYQQKYIIPNQTIEHIESPNQGKLINTFKITK